MNDSCICNSAPKLIFSCAGAADVGEIADRAARKLHKEGSGKLFCLAGIGAGLNNFIEQTKGAPKVLVIDGCPVDCAKKLMEKNGIQDFDYIRITDNELEKGKSPATEEHIEKIAAQGRSVLLSDKEIVQGA
ncbi:MAG TPA: putative zinc-binding protein [Chitinispirillaceae bacterium]|nr:putative zinc-binding protein [Chitinispirillaceae bacterium]